MACCKTGGLHNGILVLLSGISMPSNGILCLWFWDSFLYGFCQWDFTVPELNIYYYMQLGPPRIPDR